MTTHIYDDNALQLLAQIEGALWEQLQHASPSLGTSFFTWFGAWQAKQASEYRDSEDPLADFVEVSHDGVIYGEGGWHRWKVTAQGELVLLRWSSRAPRIAQAQELGFSVSP